jgi:hypothetical protein
MKIFLKYRVLFNPRIFFGVGWSIDEQDDRALLLNGIDTSEIILETALVDGENLISGEEKINRLKKMDNRIRLGADLFKKFWENQYLIPEEFKERINDKITFIFFDGTVLKNPRGNRCVWCLFWKDQKWNKGCLELKFSWSVSCKSATLKIVA